MGLIVTRFAPSPTGHLHVGGARTALLCWAFAQRARLDGHDGRFMIRVEDTDQARSSDESARGILDDLAWLGINWDDGPKLGDIGGDSRHVGPYFQAQRIDIYNAYIEHLVRLGRAYPAFETSDDLDRLRKEAIAKKANYKYARPADVKLGEFNADRWTKAQTTPHVIRFVMPPTPIHVQDQILGEVKFAAGEVDDFVIRKQDGFPTYHFAVVIDDELMGVTHVLRAQEHLINTPRHVALQGALTRLVDDRAAAKGSTGQAFRVPFYGHMPLIFNMDGAKMSKRDKAKVARKTLKDHLAKSAAGGGTPSMTIEAVAAAIEVDAASLRAFAEAENDSLETAALVAAHFNVALPEIEVWDYRKSGYLAEAITNFLALLGWSTGVKDAQGKDVEKFDLAFLAQHFDIARIGKTAAKFDRVKLLSFNGDAIAALSDTEFERRLTTWATQWEPNFAAKLASADRARRATLLRTCKSRCKTLRDATRVMAFALVTDEALTFDPAAVVQAKLEPSGMGRETLSAFAEFISSSTPFDPTTVDAWIKSHAEQRGVKMGEIATPIRVGLTGTNISPPLGDVVSVLGTAGALRRIQRCLGAH